MGVKGMLSFLDNSKEKRQLLSLNGKRRFLVDTAQWRSLVMTTLGTGEHGHQPRVSTERVRARTREIAEALLKLPNMELYLVMDGWVGKDKLEDRLADLFGKPTHSVDPDQELTDFSRKRVMLDELRRIKKDPQYSARLHFVHAESDADDCIESLARLADDYIIISGDSDMMAKNLFPIIFASKNEFVVSQYPVACRCKVYTRDFVEKALALKPEHFYRLKESNLEMEKQLRLGKRPKGIDVFTSVLTKLRPIAAKSQPKPPAPPSLLASVAPSSNWRSDYPVRFLKAIRNGKIELTLLQLLKLRFFFAWSDDGHYLGSQYVWRDHITNLYELLGLSSVFEALSDVESDDSLNALGTVVNISSSSSKKPFFALWDNVPREKRMLEVLKTLRLVSSDDEGRALVKELQSLSGSNPLGPELCFVLIVLLVLHQTPIQYWPAQEENATEPENEQEKEKDDKEKEEAEKEKEGEEKEKGEDEEGEKEEKEEKEETKASDANPSDVSSESVRKFAELFRAKDFLGLVRTYLIISSRRPQSTSHLQSRKFKNTTDEAYWLRKQREYKHAWDLVMWANDICARPFFPASFHECFDLEIFREQAKAEDPKSGFLARIAQLFPSVESSDRKIPYEDLITAKPGLFKLRTQGMTWIQGAKPADVAPGEKRPRVNHSASHAVRVFAEYEAFAQANNVNKHDKGEDPKVTDDVLDATESNSEYAELEISAPASSLASPTAASASTEAPSAARSWGKPSSAAGAGQSAAAGAGAGQSSSASESAAPKDSAAPKGWGKATANEAAGPAKETKESSDGFEVVPGKKGKKAAWSGDKQQASQPPADQSKPAQEKEKAPKEKAPEREKASEKEKAPKEKAPEKEKVSEKEKAQSKAAPTTQTTTKTEEKASKNKPTEANNQDDDDGFAVVTGKKTKKAEKDKAKAQDKSVEEKPTKPAVDDDGFEVVAKKGKGKAKR